MKIQLVISKFEEIITEIKNNIEKYDSQRLLELVNETQKQLEACYKLDEDILAILKEKSYFKTLSEMKKLVKQLAGNTSSKRKRSEAEIENALILAKKGFTASEFKTKIPIKLKSVSKKKKIKKKDKSGIKIPDMGQIWIKMSEDELRKEFSKYTEVSDLKKAADSLFKGNDRRLRKREKIEGLILQRIHEKIGLFQLGQ